MKRAWFYCFVICFFPLLSGGQGIFPDREYEPVVIYGGSLPALYRLPVEEIAVYAFDSTSQTWHIIPYQVDEVGTDAFFGGNDGFFDGDTAGFQEDQVVFMLRDAGDKAPSNSWPQAADPETPRYEVRLYAEEGGPMAYLYLYRVPGGPDQVANDYVMRYDATADAVQSKYYRAVFDSSISLRDVFICQSQGGDSVDFVDTQKMRLKGRFYFSPIDANEEIDFVVKSIDVVAGPVRIIRRAVAMFIGISQFTFTARFYPYSMEAGRGKHELDPSYHIELIRQSLDLDVDAIGMTFHNSYNSGLLIDGQSDDPNRKLDVDSWNWFMVTGSHGTLVSLLHIPEIGSSQVLYYWDNAGGGTDDGTVDTGDGRSYGDAGVRIQGTNISGEFAIPTTIYFLPPNQTSAIASQLQEQMLNPIKKFVGEAQAYTAVPTRGFPSEPRTFSLLPAFPNPFNNSTTLVFALPRSGAFRLSIYDALGKEVRELVAGRLGKGTHRLVWDGRDQSGRQMPSGLYIVQLEHGERITARKLLLLR